MTSTLLASARIGVKELLNGKVLSTELLVAFFVTSCGAPAREWSHREESKKENESWSDCS